MLDQERAMLYARLQDTEKRSAKARREQAEMEEREQLEEERQHEEARVAQAQNISRIEKLKRDTEAELQRLTDRQYEEARAPASPPQRFQGFVTKQPPLGQILTKINIHHA